MPLFPGKLVLILLACGPRMASGGAGDAEVSPAREAMGPEAAHRRMLDLLADIRTESQAGNPFLQERNIVRLEQRRAGLLDDASGVRLWRLDRRLGAEYLRVGRTEDSIAAYERAVARHSAMAGKLERGELAAAFFDLGVAHLRRGEDQNCCLRSNQDSCILPIRGGGLHADTSGSEQAIDWFMRTLELADPSRPLGLEARWLLNIAHMTLGTYPDGVPERWLIDPRVFDSDEGFPRFVDVAPRVGLGSSGLAGGAIAEDFDGDGRLDVMVSSSDTGGQLRLYGNDGSGRFVERTAEANLIGIFGGLNLAHADYDGDGDADVLVLRGGWWREHGRHPVSLLQNDGRGRFADVTLDVGLGEQSYPTLSADFADYDNDGDLDLYVAHEWEPQNPGPSRLFRNDGGRFTDVARAAGVGNERYAKGAAWGDFDGDRFPDLYVSNMAGANRLYRNQGDGTFVDVALSAGVEKPFSSFACWFFDHDNDGALDVWVAGYGGPQHPPSVADVAASYLGLPHLGERMRLYRGDGRGGFRDVAQELGLDRYTLPMGANFGDLDNDGFLDMYLATGYPQYEGLIPNVMYRNRRGQGFADVTTAGGFGHLQKGHGVAFADFDEDGDQDVLVRVGGAYPGDGYRCSLFENPGFDAHWIKVRLVGTTSNRFGLGARIRADVVEEGVRRSIFRTVDTGGSFGCNPMRQELGLGSATRVETLEVYWPTSDTRQVFHDVPSDRTVEIREDADELVTSVATPFRFAR